MKYEGIKQLGKLLSEIVSNLKEYPVFLFGIASMLIAIISIWIVVFPGVSLPESLTWFPYALLVFGILVIILSPANPTSASDTINVTQPNTDLKISVGLKWLFTPIGRVNIILSGFNLLWSVYFGANLGYGLNSLWNSIYSWFTKVEPAQINYGWIIGSATIGLFTSLGVIVLTLLFSTVQKQLIISCLLLASFIVEIIFILALSFFYSPLIAITWWLSQGNILITSVVSFAVSLTIVTLSLSQFPVETFAFRRNCFSRLLATIFFTNFCTTSIAQIKRKGAIIVILINVYKFPASCCSKPSAELTFFPWHTSPLTASAVTRLSVADQATAFQAVCG